MDIDPKKDTSEIRPISKRTKSAYLQVGVETYGGGIWHSWLDRDLSVAGRIVTAEKSGTYKSKLIKIDRPILRIPTLAIHCKFVIPFCTVLVIDQVFSGPRGK